MATISKLYFKNPQIIAALDSAASVSDAEDLLNDFAAELLKVYTPNTAGRPLVDAIDEDWSLFTDENSAQTVLNLWLADDSLNPAGLGLRDIVSYNTDILSVKITWEALKDEIKHRRRFNIDTISLDNLGWNTFLADARKDLDSGSLFYRARMLGGQPNLFPTDKMGAPDAKYSTAGRANPEGISYLYLSSDALTTLYEVRATYLDRVAVGEFHIKAGNTVTIMDFTLDRPTIPLVDNDLSSAMKVWMLIKVISDDLSTPMRSFYSSVEYVPTQFICEYIRYKYDVDGICFNSSLHSGGINYVIFKPELFECVDVFGKEICTLELDCKNI